MLLLLGACTPPPAESPEPAAPASVAITSHADGDVIFGLRDVTVVASLTDAELDAVITAEHNGVEVSVTRSDDTISVPLSLADHANSLTITVANPDQDAPATAALNLDYPFVSFTDGQEATLVIGQPDFTTITEAATDKEFDGLYGRPLLVNDILYLPDYSLDRVLGYDGVPTTNGAAADFVLGKVDFDDSASPTSPAGFGGPQTVTTDGERLFVTDYSKARILIYNTLPTTSGAAADHVIGQADFTSEVVGCSATRFEDPESAIVANGKLIVADGGNNRVLIWNTVPTVLDTPADLVLGQNSMDTCAHNDDDQDGSSDAQTSNRTLDWPTDVWSDGERLVVTDDGNSRVLIWTSFPTSNFTPADLVLGQPDFSSASYNSGPSGLDSPYMLHSNGNQLFVADSDNHRVLIWNEFPTENGQAADVVLGQADMTADTEDAGGSVSAAGLDTPNGVYVHGNRLFIADYGNDRYLVFEGANP